MSPVSSIVFSKVGFCTNFDKHSMFVTKAKRTTPSHFYIALRVIFNKWGLTDQNLIWYLLVFPNITPQAFTFPRIMDICHTRQRKCRIDPYGP